MWRIFIVERTDKGAKLDPRMKTHVVHADFIGGDDIHLCSHFPDMRVIIVALFFYFVQPSSTLSTEPERLLV